MTTPLHYFRRSGMAVKTLNKRSSVEWWMATLDRTIQRGQNGQPTTTERLDFHKKTDS